MKPLHPEMYDRHLTHGDARDEYELQQQEAEQAMQPCECLDYCEADDPYSKTPKGLCREKIAGFYDEEDDNDN